MSIEPSELRIDWQTPMASGAVLSQDARYFIAPAGMGAYTAHERRLPQSRDLGIAPTLEAAKALCVADAGRAV